MAVNTTVQVTLPQMGESVTEGTVLEWHKQEGDSVEADEILVEISTDKVDAEVPSPASGTVVKIHAAEGDTVDVGAVLAEIVPETGAPPPAPAEPEAPAAEPAANGDEPEAQAPGEQTEAPTEVASQPEAGDGQAATGGEVVDIVTPAGGESVTEGTILEWSVKVGDAVEDGQAVVEISTDKVDMELPAPTAGTITEILAEEGETVTVGQVIARMQLGAGAGVAKPKAEPSGNGAAAAEATAPTAPAIPDDAKVSPVAARVAAAEGIDLSSVAGSGPNGRITKADVLGRIGNGSTAAPPKDGDGAAPAPSPAAPATADGSSTLLKGGAAMLARYMDESRSIPTATSFRTITVTAMDTRRKQLKNGGQNVPLTPLIAYAISQAAQHDMPVMTHHFDSSDGKPHRVDDGQVNLGIAVDVEKKDGTRTLMVPVIRDAGRKNSPDFKAAFDELIEKARTNTLTADDLTGANISLTNPGGIGTIASVPRLMVGQGTIVATGSIAYPVGLQNIGDMIGAEKVMTMTSTYDHRVIQGAESGRFLQVVEAYLQGDHGFYDGVFASLGAELGPPPVPPAPAAAAAAACPRLGAGPAPPPVPPAPAAAAAAARDVAPAAPTTSAAVDEQMLQAVQAATSLLKAPRTHGHLAARLDPLGTEPEGDPALEPTTVGLTPEVMAKIPAKILRMYVPGATLADALPHLRETYCGTIAYEIEHIASHRRRMWLREKIGGSEFRKPLTNDEQHALLQRLVEVDALERFMHKAYLGQKQFSIEGLDMTVPMLDEIIQLAAAHGAREVVVGMAHRGRLNVLAHNLGRPYETIFAEFEGASTLEAVTSIPQGGTGDVKYHHGAQGTYQLPNGDAILVNLESNPSHLEVVPPARLGATRPAEPGRQGPHANRDTNAAVPIVLHGDAAMPGQGVVAESLNLQALDGYKVGGTIHLVQNNQVGFTTDPEDARSTRWASDIAKGYDTPIIHVNADDVAACVAAVRLAFAFREEFGHDVVLDLIGYRRFDHNEADEPAYTQPEMYAKIKAKKRVSELWAEKLVADGVISQEGVERQRQEVWDELTRLHQDLKAQIKAAEDAGTVEQATGEYQLDRSPSPEVQTAVSADRLRSLNEELLRVPEG